MDKDAVLNKINNVAWYHGFEIIPGVRTPGRVPARAREVFDNLYKLPADLSGLKALDIGAYDGPYSFELERRGADVTALDLRHPDSTAFNTAKEILGSKVRHVQAGVYDLSKVLKEKFDVVLFLGVYYHLKHPLLALEEINKVLKPGGIMLIEGECILNYAPLPQECREESVAMKPRWGGLKGLFSGIFSSRSTQFAKALARTKVPITLFYHAKYKGAENNNWFTPNFACLREWLEASRFALGLHGFTENAAKHSQRFWGVAKKTDDLPTSFDERMLKR